MSRVVAYRVPNPETLVCLSCMAQELSMSEPGADFLAGEPVLDAEPATTSCDVCDQPLQAGIDAAPVHPFRCPRCGTQMEPCETGDPGCLHCPCGYDPGPRRG